MFIFRFEHNRTVCQNDDYMIGGDSLTGHGTFTFCPNKGDDYPSFGFSGSVPENMMEYERCAVTALQFDDWNSGYRSDLETFDDWDLIAYWVEDNMRDIDWRVSRNQILFNPAFAVNMGKVSLRDVDAFMTPSY